MTGDDPLSSMRAGRPVDPRFADRLESSLRIQHAAGRHRPDRSPWRQLLLVGPAIVLVVLASAVLILRDDAQSSALVLLEAQNVVVTLPDGTTLVDPVGLELVDGAVVTVLAGGRAVIDDIELGPDSMVTVRAGVLVTADPATTTSLVPSNDRPTDGSVGPATSSPVDPPVDGRVDAPPDRDRDRVPGPTAPVATEPSDREPTDAQSPDAPSITTVAPDPGVDPGPGDVGDEPHRIVDLALTVRLDDGAVAVGWRATGVGVDDLRVVLLRSHGPDAAVPDWPLVGPVMIAAETTGSEPGEFLDVPPDSGTVIRYRAVALLGDDVVARSVAQTLALDR